MRPSNGIMPTPVSPPDRGRYFRAMLVNLIAVDVSEYGLQT